MLSVISLMELMSTRGVTGAAGAPKTPRCHLSWSVAVGELPVRDALEPSRCHDTD